MDLGFLIDATTTVMRSGSRYYRQFLREIVKRLIVSKSRTRVAVYTFASRTSRNIGFAGSYSRGQVYSAVNGIRQLSGARYLGKALRDTKTYMFRGKPQCGRRRILIVLTGGGSVDRARGPALSLLGSGVEIFVIGVGRVSSQSLIHVTTDRQHVFVVGYSRLYSIVQTLMDKICCQSGELFYFAPEKLKGQPGFLETEDVHGTRT